MGPIVQAGSNLLLGSVISGAFLLLFILAVQPRPARINAIWILGIPALVALGQPRWRIILMIPFIVLGWLACAVEGWLLQTPVD